jgi:hypothetical protein
MTGRDIYEVWAPAFDEWSPWVKPVLFAEIDGSAGTVSAPMPPSRLRCSVGARRDTALVVDLPGPRSLMAGFDLAKDGYRPVPLYNTTSGRRQRVSPEKCVLTDVGTIVQMLCTPLPEYVRNTIVGDNPPAFLLDSRRLQGDRKLGPGLYDNRWMVFPQDFPSARFLRSRGITQAIVLQETLAPAEDLTHVLLRWKQGGIGIYLQDADEASSLQLAELRRPSRFRWALYRTLALLGLRRNSAGGFGSIVPIPGESGGYGHGFG